MVYHNRIDISKGIDPLKSVGSKKCVACQYCFLVMCLDIKNLLVIAVMIC